LKPHNGRDYKQGIDTKKIKLRKIIIAKQRACWLIWKC